MNSRNPFEKKALFKRAFNKHIIQINKIMTENNYCNLPLQKMLYADAIRP